jgi:hypothetical protein
MLFQSTHTPFLDTRYFMHPIDLLRSRKAKQTTIHIVLMSGASSPHPCHLFIVLREGEGGVTGILSVTRLLPRSFFRIGGMRGETIGGFQRSAHAHPDSSQFEQYLVCVTVPVLHKHPTKVSEERERARKIGYAWFSLIHLLAFSHLPLICVFWGYAGMWREFERQRYPSLSLAANRGAVGGGRLSLMIGICCTRLQWPIRAVPEHDVEMTPTESIPGSSLASQTRFHCLSLLVHTKEHA